MSFSDIVRQLIAEKFEEMTNGSASNKNNNGLINFFSVNQCVSNDPRDYWVPIDGSPRSEFLRPEENRADQEQADAIFFGKD